MPLVLAVAFAVKNRSVFDASVCFWWFGQSAADCAPYAADARSLRLPLISGFTGSEVEGHDWEFILGHLNLLAQDQAIAAAFLWTGLAVMLLAMVSGIVCVVAQVIKGQAARDAEGRC